MSSGLIHLTRVHSQRSQSGSLANDNDDELSYEDNVRLRRNEWSWSYLKAEFVSKDFEKLFHKYQARLQHSFFMVLLVLNIIFNIIAISMTSLDKVYSGFHDELFIRISALIVYAAFLILTCMSEQWLRSRCSRIISALTILITMIVSEHAAVLFSFTSESAYPLEKIRPTIYLILTNHVFLPFPSKIYSCFGTIVIVFLELILSIKSRLQANCSSSHILRYAIAEVVFYLIGAFIGFFLTFLLEIANRKTFLDHRSSVESKFKLDYEKEQQDSLLNSCIPGHLIERVRNDIKMVIKTNERHLRGRQRPFNELYVEKYKNVSILYADIVNSMLLAAKLTPNELVETLNTLFARFDECSEKNSCLRIKLLGDCYYCVSGLPNYDEMHALNCVKMGLDMISIIQSVREEREVDVNMRIGIHSGMVLSGLLGLHKWHFDIWSIDTMKAASMEHNGVPGMVHITQTTLDLIPKNEREKLIIEEKINEDGEKTYLLSENEEISRKYDKSNGLKAGVSLDSLLISSRQRTILVESLQKYREMVRYVNHYLEKAIDDMPLGKKSLWRRQGINPLFLNFTRTFASKYETTPLKLETRFAQQEDRLFHYYLYSSAIIYATIILIKIIIHEKPLSPRIITIIVIVTILMTIAIGYTLWIKGKVNYTIQIITWLNISIWLFLCGIIDIAEENCPEKQADNWSNCSFTWYYTFCCILALTSISLFIRINVWLKFILNMTALLIFINLTYYGCYFIPIVGKNTKQKYLDKDSQLGHIYYMLTVSILLHITDRQIEYILRLGFKWTIHVEVERNQSLVLGEINRILLENILPQHLAQRYLYSSFNGGYRLYHESYEAIAVMFASIPNYAAFYTETIINEEGLKCLQLLNEIICDFDKLLANPLFSRIEKIKTIGSTYMAASGLQPGRGSTDSEANIEDTNVNVVQMVNFAIALMETLARINKDAFQDFKLRIGISVGPVIAGVVGATKPQYDIWGDTVNVASRMDSFGLNGRINITQPVALTLSNCCFTIQCRGAVMIKGKGKMITYLVKTPFDS